MKIFEEFKEFAVKGNMFDMAIGIIIGASFNSVIDVLVKKIFLPPLSLLSNGINLESKKIILREAYKNNLGETTIEEVAISYGVLIETLLDFLIVGFTIFFVTKIINKINKKAEDPEDNSIKTPKNIELLININKLFEEQNELLRSKTKKNISKN
ncbi:large conductance mechanosensitive channel protein MscL [Polaribacter sp.]|uniref:large conductance mechanosensitive channel protein MscL n=1 Tax=Polaribacter sp. TaxID=1920175 RepID=UPI0025D84983|nr:large conductance mechanosensitive channel protein MscL [Polaribacter sp.]